EEVLHERVDHGRERRPDDDRHREVDHVPAQDEVAELLEGAGRPRHGREAIARSGRRREPRRRRYPRPPRMDLSLFFAGTAGSVPPARRGLPATLLRRGADRLLFDCGEGTQRQLLRTVGLPDIEAVYLTHLHADHWLRLPRERTSLTISAH